MDKANKTKSLPPQYAKAILNSYYYALEVGRPHEAAHSDYEQEALETAATLKQMLIDHGVLTA